MAVLHICNKSKAVTDSQVEEMVSAIDVQLTRDVSPAWSTAAVPVTFAGRRARPRAGDWVITIIDDADTSGDLAWHDEARGGVIFGRVFAKPCLENLGADPLKSVASTLSHEAIETMLDPNCTYWAASGQGFLIAREACDPVQGFAYRIGRVSVSDFVYPAYFDSQARAGARLDHMRKLAQPFGLTKGGYFMQRRGARVVDKEGEEYPGWRRKVRAVPGSRSSRRKGAWPVKTGV